MIYLNEQLQLIHFLQQVRNPSIDAFFRFLNFFDTDYFVCSLIAFVWIGCSWKWGCRLAILTIISGILNAWAKMAFGLPRPFFYDTGLGIVQLPDFGFPSGGAQTSLLFACLIIYFWKNRFAWPAGLFYVLLISFSRIFLGVHFPLDVLGGWAIGGALFFAFIKLDPIIERLAALRPQKALFISLLAALALALFAHDLKIRLLAVTLLPVATGIYFSTRFHLYVEPPQGLWKNIILGLFGIISSIGICFFIGLLSWPEPMVMFAQVMAAGLWISLGASPFCRKIFLKMRFF